uniref:Secreted protein n=1 Tax=Heterorhabditis bacteriophora TaxID=37862 RepID=A0A1I7WFQ7_HETBA
MNGFAFSALEMVVFDTIALRKLATTFLERPISLAISVCFNPASENVRIFSFSISLIREPRVIFGFLYWPTKGIFTHALVQRTTFCVPTDVVSMKLNGSFACSNGHCINQTKVAVMIFIALLKLCFNSNELYFLKYTEMHILLTFRCFF